jgi:hypothetical protein
MSKSNYIKLVIAGLLITGLTGCSAYHEKFTFRAPTQINGDTNVLYKTHEVNLTYSTFLMWGKANLINAQIQTEEYIRSLNAEGLAFGVQTNIVKELSEGIAEGVVKGVLSKP